MQGFSELRNYIYIYLKANNVQNPTECSTSLKVANFSWMKGNWIIRDENNSLSRS